MLLLIQEYNKIIYSYLFVILKVNTDREMIVDVLPIDDKVIPIEFL